MEDKKLLVVDDDLDIVGIIKATLKAEGRAVITACDGVEAVEKAFSEAPDLILLDVMMPKMNGYQVCRLLKNDKNTWHIPIVMLTAREKDKDRFYGMSAGADDYLVKPFHAQELKDKVGAYLDRPGQAAKACPIELPSRISEANLLSKVNTLLDKKLQEMTFLQFMTRAMVSTFDEDRILKTALDGISTYLGYRQAVVFMLDETGHMKELVSMGYPHSPEKRTFHLDDAAALSRLMRSREPVFLPGRPVDMGPEAPPAGKDAGAVRQQGIVPIVSREEVRGVMLLEGRAGDPPFSEERMGVLATLAGQLGLALDNARLYKATLHLSKTDGLTGLTNARSFYDELEDEILRARRYNHDLSLFMLDIDFFKHFNDAYGHLCGDDALKHVAGILKENSRNTDTAARYGGEEFCIILPETSAEKALVLAERIRKAVEESPIDPGCGVPPAKLTISIGIANLPPEDRTAEEFVKMADRALYEAKESGRNRVCVYRP